MPKRVQLSGGEAIWRTEVDNGRVTVGDANDVFVVEGDGGNGYTVRGPDRTRQGVAAATGDTIWVGLDGDVFEFTIVRGPAAGRGGAQDRDALSPPMAATVVRIAVKPGDRVAAGDLLVALEAMKMELPIRAPRDGVVSAVNCQEGELVKPGTPVIELQPT